ncbi:hypothetical protein Mal64_09730 [Pseudobythopirellula maris]|uniref:DUF403 domain-containing protein n=1 Tax=Pseudobythopirellula maris TaxID=2527991 RepID=A0A5C5ZSV3_9BACT|nr:alpha-E domain-containing protein [Pseudobythopirellula maris]TWT90579.1 hypothetical protein Mal64_09730 [Pseudobythopirellula maris]
MLCRVADSLHWMSRYVERAENIARFIDVNQVLSLGGVGVQWDPLIFASGDEKAYNKKYPDFSRENVLRFLLFDREYANSVVSCASRARENARAIQGELSMGVWHAVNRLYLRVRDGARNAEEVIANPNFFLERVKRSCHQVMGVSNATLSRDEAWQFCHLGTLVERADKTSRILDVKYFTLLPNVTDVGGALDVVQWSALLETTGATHMYRKRHGRIDPRKVVAFLVLDEQFPRSIRYCVEQAEDCMRDIASSTAPGDGPLAQIGEMSVRLNSIGADEIVDTGLHEFIDDFQRRLDSFNESLFEAYFHVPPVLPYVPDGAQSQTQSGPT